MKIMYHDKTLLSIQKAHRPVRATGRRLFAYIGLAAAVTATAIIVIVTTAAAEEDYDKNDNPRAVVVAKKVTTHSRFPPFVFTLYTIVFP